jgi:hypothetical protein
MRTAAILALPSMLALLYQALCGCAEGMEESILSW